VAPWQHGHRLRSDVVTNPLVQPPIQLNSRPLKIKWHKTKAGSSHFCNQLHRTREPDSINIKTERRQSSLGRSIQRSLLARERFETRKFPVRDNLENVWLGQEVSVFRRWFFLRIDWERRWLWLPWADESALEPLSDGASWNDNIFVLNATWPRWRVN